MAQSHEDRLHLGVDPFMRVLEKRANEMQKQKLSEITGGKEGEKVLAQWKTPSMSVTIRPDDPQGIMRISVGGGSKTPVPLNYCTVRGDIGEAISLLEQAIEALRRGE